MMTGILSLMKIRTKTLIKMDYITLIRVKDPSGKYMESDEDKRIMVEADLSKGQTGDYLLFTQKVLIMIKMRNFNEDGAGRC